MQLLCGWYIAPLKPGSKICVILQPAAMIGMVVSVCLPGTRVNVLNLVTDWVINGSGNRISFGFKVWQDQGKVACQQPCQSFWRNQPPCAFLFFNRNVAEQEWPGTCNRTLAFKWATLIANWKPFLLLLRTIQPLLTVTFISNLPSCSWTNQQSGWPPIEGPIVECVGCSRWIVAIWAPSALLGYWQQSHQPFQPSFVSY